MKDRGKINLAIDVLLFLFLSGMAGIGFLVKYVLPPGRERIQKFGDNTEFVFLRWDRHQWGDIHYWAAWVLLALLVLHIVFHWKLVVVLVRRVLPGVYLCRFVVVAFISLIALLFVFPALIKPTTSKDNDFLYRNSRRSEIHPVVLQRALPQHLHSEPVQTSPAVVGEDEPSSNIIKEVKPESAHVQHEYHQGEEVIQGNMAILDVARRFRISTLEVKKRLGLPGGVSSLETIGRLRRRYGFSMTEARNRLEKRPAIEQTSAASAHEDIP